jgi:hypothetical protein
MNDTKPSLLDRLKEAAVEQVREQQAEHRRIADLVLGRDSRNRVTDLTKLGDDYVVEVTARSGAYTWTTVVNGKKTSVYHERQEDAVLHLIARRYDDNINSNVQAAFYAGRVLGVGTTPVDLR